MTPCHSRYQPALNQGGLFYTENYNKQQWHHSIVPQITRWAPARMSVLKEKALRQISRSWKCICYELRVYTVCTSAWCLRFSANIPQMVLWFLQIYVPLFSRNLPSWSCFLDRPNNLSPMGKLFPCPGVPILSVTHQKHHSRPTWNTTSLDSLLWSHPVARPLPLYSWHLPLCALVNLPHPSHPGAASLLSASFLVLSTDCPRLLLLFCCWSPVTVHWGLPPAGPRNALWGQGWPFSLCFDSPLAETAMSTSLCHLSHCCQCRDQSTPYTTKPCCKHVWYFYSLAWNPSCHFILFSHTYVCLKSTVEQLMG